VTSLMEQGLRLVLARKPERKRRARVVLPVSSARGGTLPGIDLNNSAALEDVMNGIRR
jgi:hypothetical protein